MAKTMDLYHKGVRPNGSKITEQRRFDQDDHRVYPNFEPSHKGKVLSNTGWGLDRIKYKTAHPQKGLSVDREHLKYFNKRFDSKFNGGKTGYSERQPDKVQIDLNPEVYHINYPKESRIPLGSLEMSRQTNFFQNTQTYLHKRAIREASFG